jgi:hypothetical protein
MHQLVVYAVVLRWNFVPEANGKLIVSGVPQKNAHVLLLSKQLLDSVVVPRHHLPLACEYLVAGVR